VGKQEGKTPLARAKRMWVDNIKTDLEDVWGGVDWIDLTRDKWRALVNEVMKLTEWLYKLVASTVELSFCTVSQLPVAA
jgi:hypothetical protein